MKRHVLGIAQAALGLVSILGFAAASDNRGFSLPIVAAAAGVGDEQSAGRVVTLAMSTPAVQAERLARAPAKSK
jgi:hypothetical protein